jgi:hypothetical protein
VVAALVVVAVAAVVAAPQTSNHHHQQTNSIDQQHSISSHSSTSSGSSVAAAANAVAQPQLYRMHNQWSAGLTDSQSARALDQPAAPSASASEEEIHSSIDNHLLVRRPSPAPHCCCCCCLLLLRLFVGRHRRYRRMPGKHPELGLPVRSGQGFQGCQGQLPSVLPKPKARAGQG